MSVVSRIENNIKIAAVYAGFLHPGDADVESFRGNGGKNPSNLLLIRPQIQKGPHNHISADTGFASIF